MEENEVRNRLLQYVKSKGMTQLQFTQRLGVSPSYVATMRRGLSLSKLEKIGELFPDLNRDWLMYGNGEMLNAADEPGAEPVAEYEVRLLPVAAFAGNLQLWSEGVADEDCARVISPVRGADFAIPICGDSMEPDFVDGSTVLIKRINEQAFIPWGNAMVIDTENGVLLKDVYPDEKEDCIEARSRNQRYPSLHIPKSSIYGLYRVLCSLKMFPTM